MEQSATDLVMKFVLDRNAVQAECALEVASGDALMAGFTKRNDSGSFANFFEVSNFDFGVSLKEGDKSTNTMDGLARAAQSSLRPLVAGAFARWRSATQQDYKSIYYPLEFDRFSFDRIIDCASPIFFQSCCTSQTFDSAALVKRVSPGDEGGVSRPAVGFLRIDFTKVLVTGINWDDGDMVKERCEFICQGMKITYRRQTAGGGVSSGGGNEFSAVWPNPNKDRTLGITNRGAGTK